jgi:hypothetical protein
MLTFVRLAVLSFLLAFASVASMAAGFDHNFVFNPRTGMIGRVVGLDSSGTNGVAWPVTEVEGEREKIRFDTTEWILDVELPKEEAFKPVVTFDFEKAAMAAKFPDGRYLLSMVKNGYRITTPDTFFPLRVRPRIDDHQGRLENGDLVQVKGLLKDGRLWVGTLGDPKGYFRAREGVVIFPTASELEQDSLELIQETVAQDFDGFNVRGLDLTDPTQFQLFRLYILTRFMKPNDGFRRINMRSDDLLAFFAAHPNLPPKLEVNTIDLQMGSRHLRLRQMEPLESVFRGCLGDDCSTDTRFFRALEPAHINFAIEEVPYKGLGQIEVILGKYSYFPAKKLAFLERVQSSKNLRENELRALVISVYAEMKKAGYTLVMPKTLKTYTEVAHPISNSVGLQERLEAMFASSFVQGEEFNRFLRDKDVLPNGDAIMMNMVAHGLWQNRLPVYEIEPTPEALQDHLDHASIVQPYHQPTDLKAFLAKLRAKIALIPSGQKAHDLMISKDFFSSIEAKIFTSPCEYRVAN